ncbi:NmrA family NAD(P)-binding protein [Sphingomonas sp. MMS24-J13]|uniref:NAD(P)H-binding protein n=1 Tax=Sphingomonas sp. MMS24-J13 TaxID=3238686 RepID=UPI00384B3A10
MYAITGASGQLGRLTIEKLLTSVPPSQIVAAVRNPEAVEDLVARGVQVRHADYDQPETLAPAFAGVTRLLLISSNLTTGRLRHHQAVIDAAKAAGVSLIAYTSMLHADRPGAKLAVEHRETELALEASGIAATFLRNGWYTENYLMALQPALAAGALYGAAADGKISLAARADYAEAAAAALVAANPASIYELAGDTAWTLSDLAAEVSRQAGKPLAYVNLAEGDYEKALVSAGLPSELADLLADADANAGKGVLFDDDRALSRLIGRPTTPVAESIGAALGRAIPSTAN